MEITKQMAEEVNVKLDDVGSPLRLKYSVSRLGSKCDIMLENDKYIDSYIVKPSGEFYEIINAYFRTQGIELSYNNTMTTFWSDEN